MQRYELEDTKRNTEYLLEEINKSLDLLKMYASDVGLSGYSTESFLAEMKHKLYDFYNVFVTAYTSKKEKIDEEEDKEEK